MPFTSVGTYLPTLAEFLAHWTAVNAELAPTPVILQGGYTLVNLTTDRTALENAIVAVQPAENTLTNAAADRDAKKAALRVRLRQFRALVQGQLYGSVYVRSTPKLVQFTIGEGKFISPFDDMNALWTQINAAPPPGFTGPLTLQGGYALAAFIADLVALKAAYVTYANAAKNAQIARDRRNALLAPLRARAQQYRKVAPARLLPGSALLASLPAYSPPVGATPDPVTASGAWDDAQSAAVLTWSASPHPNLDRYELRTAPAPYRASQEITLGIIDKAAVSVATAVGLGAAGSSAQFRIYVVLTTNNERGSNTVKVTHPDTEDPL